MIRFWVLLDQADGIRVEVVGDVHVPDCRAIKRAEGSGMDLRMILSTWALSPSSRCCVEHDLVPLVQLTNLKAVPTGAGRSGPCARPSPWVRGSAEPSARLFASGHRFFGDQRDGIIIDDFDLFMAEGHAGMPFAVT